MKDKRKSKKEDTGQAAALSLIEARELLDIAYLINAILQSSGNLSRAAEKLGIGRRTLYDLMEKYNISCSDGKLSIQIKPTFNYMEVKIPSLEGYLNPDSIY
ncbi:hypothetical protein FJZ33_03790 [Candidatus Poribacteria bacterium]|nr:hypothetical protein [Candidatus Poribacteria bacterium]